MFADTGVLLAATAVPEVLEAFNLRYAGRLFAAEAVVSEIGRKANQDATVDLAAAAARRVKSQMLRPGKVTIDDCADMDAAVFDTVWAQLRALPGPNTFQHENQHLGEATTISLLFQRQKSGQKVVFLANDGGARQVGQLYGISCMSFRHVLRELVCAGIIDDQAAFAACAAAHEISHLPSKELPNSADDFACRFADDGCKVCEQFS